MVEMGVEPGPDNRLRCWWGNSAPEYIPYHDSEWGRPVVDDTRLFEKLSLEGFQAGLSWLTILRKRPAFREAFAGFDIPAVARFDEADVARLLADAGIVRHEGKIRAAIGNARAALDLIDEHGSLAGYVWSSARRPAGGGAPAHLAGVRSDEQGPEATRSAVRRTDHDLRLHAGDGVGQRPPARLLGANRGGDGETPYLSSGTDT